MHSCSCKYFCCCAHSGRWEWSCGDRVHLHDDDTVGQETNDQKIKRWEWRDRRDESTGHYDICLVVLTISPTFCLGCTCNLDSLCVLVEIIGIAIRGFHQHISNRLYSFVSVVVPISVVQGWLYRVNIEMTKLCESSQKRSNYLHYHIEIKRNWKRQENCLSTRH